MKEKEIYLHPVLNNIRKIMNDRNLKQVTMAEYANTSESQFSKILSGKVQLSLWQLANIAENLQMEIIDIFTYPKKYVDSETIDNKSERISISFEVSPDKREHLLKMVTGNKDIEILNK